MMYEFLINNRTNLAARCREKVALRPGRMASKLQLLNGVPMLLDQLIRTLAAENTSQSIVAFGISGPENGDLAFSEIAISAVEHARELLALGFSVKQVVHDYGDLCQSITDLAIERKITFTIHEFRTLSRCLENATADAVTEFSYQRDLIEANKIAKENNDRLRHFVHELRNLLGTTSLAFTAAKSSRLNLSGSTGVILEKSILNLGRLIDSSVDDINEIVRQKIVLNTFPISSFIAEVLSSAELSYENIKCELRLMPVDPDLATSGNRSLLLISLVRILQNSVKFTQLNNHVVLAVYASGDQIQIDVKDNCSDVDSQEVDSTHSQSTQIDRDRIGSSLILAIAKQSVVSYGGSLSIQNQSEIGWVVKISIPRRPVVN